MIETLRSDRYHVAGVGTNVGYLPPVRGDHEVVMRSADSLGPCAIAFHGIGACARRWFQDGAIYAYGGRELKTTVSIVGGDPNDGNRIATNCAGAV